MTDFNVNHITGKQGQQGTVLAGVTTVSSTGAMRFPSGPTEQRGGRGRGVFCGGETPTKVNTLDMIEISTTGNATDFGDLSEAKSNNSSTGSSTRGVVFGGENPSVSAKIDYITFSSSGGASDFGDLTEARRGASNNASGNNIRGITGGGNPGSSPNDSSHIEYVNIASTGDATLFGDLLKPDTYLGALASPTRIIWGGGVDGPVAWSNVIQYKEIASTGNTIKFGELSSTRAVIGTAASSTRGLFMGGKNPSGTDTIEYITIATFGNVTDFGNLTAGARSNATGLSNSIRACAAGGNAAIDYVTIATTGNSADFGDLTQSRSYLSACSDSHGGIGD